MELGNPYSAIARCIMNPDKTIDYFLDINNSNIKLDGTPVDWALVERSGQNVMVQIPKFYACKKFDPITQSMFFGVSAVPKETTYIDESDWAIHPAFFKDQEKACDDPAAIAIEVPFRYIGAFSGFVDTKGRMRSLPNKITGGTSYVDMALGRAAAKVMGLGYGLFDYHLLNAIQMLYITEYSNPDCQTAIGKGSGTSSSLVGAMIPTGSTLPYGNKTFGGVPTLVAASGAKSMSYRGIESLWGGQSCFIDGASYEISTKTLSVTNKYYNNLGTGYMPLCNYPTIPGISTIKTICSTPDSGFIPATVSTNLGSGMYDGVINTNIAGQTSMALAGTAANAIPNEYNGLFSFSPINPGTLNNHRLAL